MPSNQTNQPLSAAQIEEKNLVIVAKSLALIKERLDCKDVSDKEISQQWFEDAVKFARGLTGGVHPDSDVICSVLCAQYLTIAALQAANDALYEANRWIPKSEKTPEMGRELEIALRALKPHLTDRVVDGFMTSHDLVTMPFLDDELYEYTHWRYKRTDTPDQVGEPNAPTS